MSATPKFIWTPHHDHDLNIPCIRLPHDGLHVCIQFSTQLGPEQMSHKTYECVWFLFVRGAHEASTAGPTVAARAGLGNAAVHDGSLLIT